MHTFGGKFKFQVTCSAMVAKPMPGHKLWGSLAARNKAGWVVMVHDEEVPRRPSVVSARIPNDTLDGQAVPLPQPRIGTPVQFKVLKSALAQNKPYIMVIGRLVSLGEDEDLAPAAREGIVLHDGSSDDESSAASAREDWSDPGDPSTEDDKSVSSKKSSDEDASDDDVDIDDDAPEDPEFGDDEDDEP